MANIQDILANKKMHNVEKITSGFDVSTKKVSDIVHSANLEAKYVNYDYLQVSKLNTYSVNDSEVEELANSIMNFGILLEYPIVEKISDKQYDILSGQKRFRAITEIKQNYPDNFHTIFPNNCVPCKIIDFKTFKIRSGNETLSDDAVRLMIIAESNNQREQTVRDYMLRVTQLQIVYNELKTKGMITGKRTREFIAESIPLQPRSIQKVLTSQKKMLPELWDTFLQTDDLISVRMLEELANLPEPIQLFLYNEYQAGRTPNLKEYISDKSPKQPVKESRAEHVVYTDTTINRERLSAMFAVQNFEKTISLISNDTKISQQDMKKLDEISLKLTRLNTIATDILKKYQ